MTRLGVSALLGISLLGAFSFAQQPDVAEIIKRSAEANEHDFAAEPDFNYKETDTTKTGTRTIQVTMVDGSPYEKVIALNGKPLGKEQAAAEDRKQLAAMKQRKSQSASARQARIAKYQRGQQRDHEMISQLSAAFDFAITGETKMRDFDVWILKATPKAGYQPPTMQAQVLPGMQGELWIDKRTYEWVKVTATVIRPVSIEGFLAQVQPGTDFEIEKSPVTPGIWQITHYTSHARARVLHFFSHNEDEEATYSDFEPVKP